jgi:hypothetical protein
MNRWNKSRNFWKFQTESFAVKFVEFFWKFSKILFSKLIVFFTSVRMNSTVVNIFEVFEQDKATIPVDLLTNKLFVSIVCLCLSVCLYVCACLSVCFCLPVCLYVCACLSVCMIVPVCLYVCLCLSVCLYVCVYLSISTVTLLTKHLHSSCQQCQNLFSFNA